MFFIHTVMKRALQRKFEKCNVCFQKNRVFLCVLEQVAIQKLFLNISKKFKKTVAKCFLRLSIFEKWFILSNNVVLFKVYGTIEIRTSNG